MLVTDILWVSIVVSPPGSSVLTIMVVINNFFSVKVGQRQYYGVV